jgi:hypothetical protein
MGMDTHVEEALRVAATWLSRVGLRGLPGK